MNVSEAQAESSQALGNVELRIPAKAEWVAVARLASAAIGSRLRFSIDAIEDLKLAIAEACTNCIQQSENIANIDIRCEAHPSELRVTVSGDGRGPKIESVKANPEDTLDGDGLGVFLIRSLMDEVEYDVDPVRGPRLTMIKRVED